jgi:hypothetical protein
MMRTDEMDDLSQQPWMTSKKGAKWKKSHGYVLAVWEDKHHEGEWACGIKAENAKDYEDAQSGYMSEKAAVRAVYAMLVKALGHSMA